MMSKQIKCRRIVIASTGSRTSRITRNFIMEIQCKKQNKSLPKFSNPLWETSSEAERGREGVRKNDVSQSGFKNPG